MANLFAAPGTTLGQKLTRDAAERIASNWWRLLLNGAVLIVAGVLIFSIDWSVRSLATFIGALFVFEGLSAMLTFGIDAHNLEVLDGAARSAEVTRHFLAGEHTAWILRHADRARLVVRNGVTVTRAVR